MVLRRPRQDSCRSSRIGLAGAVGFGLLGGLIASTPLAGAHWLGGAGTPVAESGAPGDAVPADYDAGGTSVEDVSAPAAKGSAGEDPSPAVRRASRRRTGKASSGLDTNQVLEIPQQVRQSRELDEYGIGDGSSESADDDDASDYGHSDQVSAAGLPPEVGTREDYEDQAIEPPLAAIVSAPGMAVPLFTSPAIASGHTTATGMPMPGGLMIARPIILPPTSSGPFPSTSPMLMSPGFAAPAYPIPGHALGFPHR